MFPGAIDNFLKLLKNSPSGAMFNPWWEVDDENDIDRNAPAIRRNQLRAYLEARVSTAKLAVIGEAVGYRGGHFSGIPMTSERLLLGRSKKIQIKSNDFFSDLNPRRTSKPEICPDGFSEPTATIVWGTLLQRGLKPDEFVLWNAFPWHSFDSRRGMLSNRMPNKSERAAGLPVLKAFTQSERTVRSPSSFRRCKAFSRANRQDNRQTRAEGRRLRGSVNVAPSVLFYSTFARLTQNRTEQHICQRKTYTTSRSMKVRRPSSKYIEVMFALGSSGFEKFFVRVATKTFHFSLNSGAESAKI